MFEGYNKKLIYSVIAAIVIVAAVVLFFVLAEEPVLPPPGGNGQATTTCDYLDTDKVYLNKDKDCTVNFICAIGKETFRDECGCGCRIASTTAPRKLIYDNKDYSFSFAFPENYTIKPDAAFEYVTKNSVARVDLPMGDLSGTNLIEAGLIAGATVEPAIVRDCLRPVAEERATTSRRTINDIEYTVYNGLGAAAGNLYDTESYRAVKNDACYEFTLLMHSGNIGNYEPGTVREFDREKTLAALRALVDTVEITGPPKNLIVSSPKAGGIAGLPLAIKGLARVFENTFAYRIKNADGTLLLERSAMSASPDSGVFGPFSVSINYPAPKTASGTVEVFEYSAKDGSEINKTVIPVIFPTVSSTIVKVFFPNTKDDPNFLNCSKVFAVERRVPVTSAVARAAIEELLLGPDRVEAEAGYITSINSGVKINKLTITSGVAKIDFDKTMEAGVGGSCRVTSIRSQITATLEQFTTVEMVEISIDGRTEDILQP